MSSPTDAAATGRPGVGVPEAPGPAPAVRLRWAARADLEAIAELDREVFPKLSYPTFVLRQHMDARPQSIFLVIEEDGVVCGYALAAVVTNDKKAWLLGLAVSAGYRGRHYGDTLLATMLRHCRADGVKQVLITVRPNNDAALGLYRKYGFHKTASEENYYGDLEPREIMLSRLGRIQRLRSAQGRIKGLVGGEPAAAPRG